MKNPVAHIAAGAIILAVTFGAGASFHHQQAANAAYAKKAHDAYVRHVKQVHDQQIKQAKADAEAKARADAEAQKQAALKTPTTTKSVVTPAH